MRLALVPLALCLACMPASAQTPAAGSAQKNSVKGSAAAAAKPTPRAPDGHPDLSGVYFPGPKDPDTEYDLRDVNGANSKFTAPLPRPSYQPWALEKIKRIADRASANITGCPPQGVIGVFLKGSNFAIQFVQTPKLFLILSEQQSSYRVIYMDGRQHPKPDEVYPLFMGHSIGHWEGDTLVVDTIGADTNTPPGGGLAFASDAAHFVEKFRRPNASTLFYEFTVDDPKVLTKPWVSSVLRYTPSQHQDIKEYYCTNNQDAALGLLPKETLEIPRTASGSDERYFDQQEYEELSKKFNNK